MLQASTDAETPHLDVLIVGAGLSGIDAAYRLQTGNPGLSYAIFEARDAIGGTWDLFRYPGIRSDSDMTTLGFPFRPWRGTRAIVDGPEIRDYIRDTARAYGIDAKVRFGHRVVAADWSSDDARWTIGFEAAGKTSTITCGFLFVCAGYYDYAQGHAPRWPGMDSFNGQIIHPQFWPDRLEVAGSRIVVIGSGATAVTLIPALVAAGAAHVTMLQRTPTYIVARPAEDRVGARLRRFLPAPIADGMIRWKNIGLSTLLYTLSKRRPHRVKAAIAKAQRMALGPDFDMRHLTPDYDPWDQRICLVPDGDLFTTLRDGKAEIVTDRIAQFTQSGLKLESGTDLPADIVVTATGLKVQMLGGAALRVDGAAVDTGTRLLYRGSMLEGVPNFAFAVGYTNASWTLKCDLTARFVSRLLRHMQRRGLASVVPKAPAGTASDAPMLDLKSGYIERAAQVMPRQGNAAPWRVHQNYTRDMIDFRTARLDDGVLRFGKQGERA